MFVSLLSSRPLPLLSPHSVLGVCPIISLGISKQGDVPLPRAPTGRVVSRVLFSPGLALCPEVHGLLEGCELPDLPSSLLLPEDMALRNLPPLRAAHRRFNFDTDRPLLSTLEEVRTLFLRPQAVLLVRHSSKAGAQNWRGQGSPPAPPSPVPPSPSRQGECPWGYRLSPLFSELFECLSFLADRPCTGLVGWSPVVEQASLPFPSFFPRRGQDK